MENTALKKSLPIIIPGAIGLILFIAFLGSYYPSRALHLTIGKSQAIEIASQFLKQKGHNLEGFDISAELNTDPIKLTYFQLEMGWDKAMKKLRESEGEGLNFPYIVSYKKNIPDSTPYENYSVEVSGSGKITGFIHQYPSTYDWPKGRISEISQDIAYRIVLDFLRERQIDLNGFNKTSSLTNKYDKWTEHGFNWIKEHKGERGKTNLSVTVRGDDIAGFRITFGIPKESLNAINRMFSYNLYSKVGTYAFAFILWLVISAIFLKKYHEGEVGVKSAVIFFFLIICAFFIECVIKYRMNGKMLNISILSPNSINLIAFIFFTLIIWPFFSIMGLTSWSVGESLGRETFSKKFTSIDSLLNRKFSTLEAARGMLQGYFAGFAGLGLISIMCTLIVRLFRIGITDADVRIVTLPAPFLVPVIIAISSGLLSEMIFRLFGNLILFKYLKSKWLSIAITSFFWTVFSIQFWGINLSIYPEYWNWIISYIIGFYLGFIFWKFDLLTVVFANFTIIGIMQSLPLVTAGTRSLFYPGLISLLLLFSPVVFIVRGYIKREKFVFKAEIMPSHIKRITERVRMAKELEIAHQVQQRLLPSKSPDIEGLDIQGLCIPANEIGGDYYDFIPVDENKLAIVIGDVSGKGMPAAIYMTLTKGILNSQVENRLSPGEVLIKVNRSLYLMMEQKSFVTLSIGIIDMETRTLRYARAGHNPLLYFRNSENRILSLKPRGIAAGIEKGNIFNQAIKEETIELEPGDVIVFYTDGFSEAMNKDLEEYGENRLIEIILKHKTKTSGEIIEALVEDVENFVKGFPQHDDMTIVAVKIY